MTPTAGFDAVCAFTRTRVVGAGVACNAIAEHGLAMTSITIRNLEEAVKRRLRVRAAEHGRSMEEEAREILRRAVNEPEPPLNLAAAIRARLSPSSRDDLELPAREPMREPPRLGKASR
jgi:plasmid stability protein